MALLHNKVRKGDTIAIEVERSHTEANTFKTTRYKSYHLATVTQADRGGWAKRVLLGGQTHNVEVARIGRVMTLSPLAYRNAAKRLVERMTYPGTTWESADALKEAIRAENAANG